MLHHDVSGVVPVEDVNMLEQLGGEHLVYGVEMCSVKKQKRIHVSLHDALYPVFEFTHPVKPPGRRKRLKHLCQDKLLNQKSKVRSPSNILPGAGLRTHLGIRATPPCEGLLSTGQQQQKRKKNETEERVTFQFP